MAERMTLSVPAAECRFEVQAGEDGKPRKIVGYPIVFAPATSSKRIDTKGKEYFARIAPGAASYPKDRAVQALYAHDRTQILGSSENGTLTWTEDAHGVRMEADPPDTSYVRDLFALLKPADGKKPYVAGMSFGMDPIEFKETVEDGKCIRTFTKISVDEFTVTASPAFTQTSVGVQMERQATGAREKFEQTPQMKTLIAACSSAAEACGAVAASTEDTVLAAMCRLCQEVCVAAAADPSTENITRCWRLVEMCACWCGAEDDDTARACAVACTAAGELCEQGRWGMPLLQMQGTESRLKLQRQKWEMEEL